MKRTFIALALVMSMSAFAMAEGEDTGTDDFFGDGDLVVSDAKTESTYQENFLKEEPLTWGGSYRFGINVAAFWDKWYADWTSDYFWKGDGEASSVDLGAVLFFTARPQGDLRYYGKFKIDYPFETKYLIDTMSASDNVTGTSIPVPSFKVWELYVNFDMWNVVNITAGKQMTKWGVGYFFQPADVISLSPVDPENYSMEREGPVMVKANLPVDVHNLDAYIIAPDGMKSAKDIAYALRGNFVVENWEFGLGGRYQYVPEGKLGSAFQAIATATGSIEKVSVFAEGVAKYGSGKTFLKLKDGEVVPVGIPVPIAGLGTIQNHETVTYLSDWFLKGTIGFVWNDSDLHLGLMGQYLYNGEGYDGDLTKLSKPLRDTFYFGGLNMMDVLDIARHYAAANVSYSFVDNSKVSVSAMWFGNLQDGSGWVNPSVSIKVTDEVKLGLNGQVKYGHEKTEYISNPMYHYLKLGFSLSLAPGNF